MYLSTAVEQDRVLPADESAIAKDDAVAVDTNRERLADRPSRILERQILDREVVGVDIHRRRAERADRQTVGPRIRGLQAVCDDRPSGILAHEGDKSLFTLDVYEFVVHAGLDCDDPPSVCARRLWRRVDGFLHGAVLPTAVGGDDRVWRRVTLTSRGGRRQRGHTHDREGG